MTDVTWHDHSVMRAKRQRLAGHGSCIVWLTGLSGSGKSTVANLVDRRLYDLAVRSYVLDGDNIRHGLNASVAMLTEQYGAGYAERFGLGFSADDRTENIRRIGAVAQLFCDAGIVTLTAFVSPYRRDRDAVRALLTEGDFIEVFVDAPLEVCESRDPKGLYRKARAGQLQGMTGIDAPYEPPLHAELVLDAGTKAAEALADDVVGFLRQAGKIE
jgi:adenylylsulfate kinase